ncbi:hypothetical protein K9M06_04835, partial [Candidatus Bipolaricaulota bacterium]|nr:hypothetical protein [Candidatus Bipolaricaulota bacterium]
VGAIWGMTACLFLLTAVLFGLKMDWWWISGFISFVISQALIVSYWQGARFGTVLNVVILVGVILGFGAWNFDRRVQGEIENVLAGPSAVEGRVITEESLGQLPRPVRKWLKNAGVPGSERIQYVKLRQKGELRLNPDGNWSKVKAEQYVDTVNPSFLWKVDTSLFSILPVAGRDKFIAGRGDMEIRLASLIPVVNERSNEKLDQAALQRYLAEIGWYPTAALSPHITWERIDDLTAEATMEYSGTSGSVKFHFKEEGELERISAMRYRGSSENDEKKEWFGEIKESRIISGVRVPSRVDISWVLDGEVFTWYRFEVTGLEYNPGQ